ncbi:MAG TPA: peptidoglycan DD-metalloendopeptidase family protein [Saprospiraceae bacterium]|jgi:septal ring factor EnvC (AmiA/AmiB activator)|nr:peptidoglycan DD-metalloendopeptidase family protein [Saprospiraceae bacterium]HRO09672.1 peptidoglycan DD-metalloendopeptidase family protein [Saprospiraceae bacterium]HRP42950.1 peptidoglycan DD-metalloendopeptidase family protein [Saprospiraceae bacterium]
MSVCIKRYSIWILVTVIPLMLPAQTRDQLEKQRIQIIRDIEKTSKQLEKTEKSKKESLDQLKVLETQVSSRKKLIDNLNAEVKLNDDLILNNENQLLVLEQKYQLMIDQYKKLLQAGYLKKMANSKWSYILSASNLNNLILRWKYIQQFDRYTEAKMEDIKRISEEIVQKNEEIAQTKEKNLTTLNITSSNISLLEKEQKEKNALIQRLSKDELAYKNKIAQREKERERLNTAIEKIIIAELAKAREKEKTQASGTKKKEIDNSGFAKNKGALNLPVAKGTITGKFGTHPHPTIKNVEVSNNGVDISVPASSSVQCIYDGEIVGVTHIPGFKNMVIIKHGNYYTVYSKLDEVSIEKGKNIKRGQSIGLIRPDENGQAELHFELWHEKTKLNPESWFNR